MNRFHRIECPILINAFNSTEIVEKDWLALRLLLVATKQGKELETLMQHPVYKNPLNDVLSNIPTTFDSKNFSHMFNLVNHLDKRPPGSWDDKIGMAGLLLYILKSSSFFGTSYTQVLNEAIKSLYQYLF